MNYGPEEARKSRSCDKCLRWGLPFGPVISKPFLAVWKSVMRSLLSNYFTRPDLAKELGRTIRTLERWEAARTGPPITWLGKQPLYRRQAVQDWLLQQKRHPPLPQVAA